MELEEIASKEDSFEFPIVLLLSLELDDVERENKPSFPKEELDPIKDEVVGTGAEPNNLEIKPLCCGKGEKFIWILPLEE